MKDYPIIFIKWRDTTSHYGWESLEDASRIVAEGLITCTAVGFLFVETEKEIALINQFSDSQVSDLHIIPKETIIERKLISGTATIL